MFKITEKKNRNKRLYRSEEVLKNLYWNEEMTLRDIAEKLGVNNSTILYQMKKHGIERRNKSINVNESVQTNHLNLSDRGIEFVEGNLLGDGSLFRHGNISSRYAHSEKNKEFLKWLSHKLKGFGIEQTGRLRKNDSESAYGTTYQYWSKSYVDLSELRERWYPLGKKSIPQNLEISPTRLFNWYLGDGTLFSNNSCRIASARPASKLEIVKNQFLDIGITCSIGCNGIYVWVGSSEDFFEYILQSDLNPPCYSYKFPDCFAEIIRGS
ncbi:hypothetical protein AKJ65_07185 [candidate division MSBL1 archaeon SCGC-AAA259E19]|uniref:Homing endonuclease LAGLIDADG domain-containing protein n=1 Tax=candidate division MSBL1 archaeon SCGC-AAA259E19 TaxID=1698264 RepID=A0A133UET4_9EURY|nr:hypothetical protein AKJ65_07185 [candidate division MSBL1 archaeon SCGC-AAA259E19]